MTPDEENLLQLDPALVQSMAARPSKLTGDSLNLNAVSKPMVEEDLLNPKENLTVTAGEPQKLPGAETAEDRLSRYMDKAESALGKSATTKSGSTLESVAPSWYKAGAPPGKNQWAQDLMSTIGSATDARTKVALADPRRPSFQKMQDANQGALLSGVTGVLSGLFGKKSSDHSDDLNSAVKEASMMRTVPGGSSSQRDADNNLKLAQLQRQRIADADIHKKREFDQQQVLDLHDPNDPEAVAAREFLDANGFPVPENMTRDQLKNMRAAINQKQNQGATSEQHSTDASNRERQAVIEANLKNEDKVSDQTRKEAADKNSADFGSDFVWRKGVVGDKDVARKAMTVRSKGLADVKEMMGIQDRLDELHKGLGGGWTGTVDQWAAQLPGDAQYRKEVSDLANRAAYLRQVLTADFRADANLGVPQVWEQRLANQLLPAAGSFTGWAKGKAAWKAFEQDVDRSTYAKLYSSGGGLKSLGDEEKAAAPYDTHQREVAPIAKAQVKMASPKRRSTDVAELPPDSLGTTQGKPPLVSDQDIDRSIDARTQPENRNPQAPKKVAAPVTTDAVGPASVKHKYMITPRGGGNPFPREMTDSEAEGMKSKMGTKYDFNRIL